MYRHLIHTNKCKLKILIGFSLLFPLALEAPQGYSGQGHVTDGLSISVSNSVIGWEVLEGSAHSKAVHKEKCSQQISDPDIRGGHMQLTVCLSL